MKDVFVIDYGVTTRYIFHGDQLIDKEQINRTLSHISRKVVDNIVYIPETIALDDTIRTVKHKIFKYCEIKDTGIDEYYITSHEMQRILADDILELIDDMGDASLQGLLLLLRNFKDERISQQEISDVKTETIENLLAKQQDFLIEKAISCNYTQRIGRFVTANPYLVTQENVDIVTDNTATNKNIDLKTLIDMNIHNHNDNPEKGLYLLNLYLAKDLFISYNESQLSTEYLVNMYFPALEMRDVSNLETLEGKKADIIIDTQSEIDKVYNIEENTLKLISRAVTDIDESKFTISKSGITSIRVKIPPSGVFRVSLENIFKLLETSKEYPLVRLNYGRGQDKLYRLYTNTRTVDNEKIPYIGKSTINKVKKLPGRANTITVYCEEQVDGSTVPIYIDIDYECNLIVTIASETTFNVMELERIIKKKTNYIVDIISSYLNNNGFYLSRFSRLTNKNTLDASHEATLTLFSRKQISFKKIKKCLGPLFYVIKDDIAKELLLIYKRVGNFNVVSDDIIEYYVTELIKQEAKDVMIIGFLTENFNIEIDTARETLIRIKNTIKLQDDLMSARAKAYTGIFVSLKKIPNSQKIHVTIKGMKDIGYINYIQHYIQGLIQLVINEEMYKDSIQQLTEIDVELKQKIVEDVGVSDEIYPVEVGFDDNEIDFDDFDLGMAGDGDLEEIIEQVKDDEVVLDQDQISSKVDKSIPPEYQYENDSADAESIVDDDTGDELIQRDDSDDEDEDEEIILDGGSSIPDEGVAFDVDDFLLQDDDVPGAGDGDIPGAGDRDVDDFIVEKREDIVSPVSTNLIDDTELFNLTNIKPRERSPSTDSDDSKFIKPKQVNAAEEPKVDESITVTKPKGKAKPKAKAKDKVEPEVQLESEKPKGKRGRKKKQPIDEILEIAQNETTQDVVSKPHPTIKLDEKDNLIDKQDLVGTKLNIFSKKLTDTDPILFVSTKDKQFDSYSRMCASNQKRQPVLLTSAEKERIDKLNPGSYDGAIYYGTNKDNKNWYICPRYWCMLNNMPLTKEQVDAGECGGKIIPHNAKTVPKDSFIYEFYNKTVHDNKGQYIQHYPGYLEPSKHRHGFCAPCCFKSVTNPAIKKRMVQCQLEQDIRDGDAEGPVEIIGDDDETQQPNERGNVGPIYKKDVLAAEKLPLPLNRFGFFPLEFEDFLGIKHSDYFKKNTNIIKPDKHHFLRIGVNNQSKNQSFVQAILWFYNNITTQQLTLKQFKEYIVEIVTLDKFLTFQNGNLYQYFNKRDADVSQVDLKKYKTTMLYSGLHEKNQEYLKRIVTAYETFIGYIMDTSNLIDYRILWDIVSNLNGIFNKSNTGLNGGVNLVIFEIVNNDATSNVSFICPSNQYSSGKYNSKKTTLMLLCNQEFYEPIVLYNDIKAKDNSVVLTPTFQEKVSDKAIIETGIIDILNIVNKATARCLPHKSIPTVYTMKSNLYLQELIKQIEKHNTKSPKNTYVIRRLVMNFNGKIIGVEVKINNKGENKYIPCFGSSLPYGIINPEPGLITTIDDITIDNYAETHKWLTLIDKTINGVECKPLFKLVNEGFVVGIITTADQFIPVGPILEAEYESLIKEELYLPTHNTYIKNIKDTDKTIGLSKNSDKKRETVINNIRLDSYYYNVFRAVVKKLINSYEYLEIKKEILDIIQDNKISIREKRLNALEKIKEVLDGNIQFVEQTKQSKKEILEMLECINKNEERCDTGICGYLNGKCTPLFPIISLTTGKNNSNSYLLRIADEMVRYNRIKRYLFDKKKYLALEDSRLTLGVNEMLMYESELNQEYLRNITSKQVDINNFKRIADTTNPKQVTVPIETAYTKQEL